MTPVLMIRDQARTRDVCFNRENWPIEWYVLNLWCLYWSIVVIDRTTDVLCLTHRHTYTRAHTNTHKHLHRGGRIRADMLVSVGVNIIHNTEPFTQHLELYLSPPIHPNHPPIQPNQPSPIHQGYRLYFLPLSLHPLTSINNPYIQTVHSSDAHRQPSRSRHCPPLFRPNNDSGSA